MPGPITTPEYEAQPAAGGSGAAAQPVVWSGAQRDSGVELTGRVARPDS